MKLKVAIPSNMSIDDLKSPVNRSAKCPDKNAAMQDAILDQKPSQPTLSWKKRSSR